MSGTSVETSLETSKVNMLSRTADYLAATKKIKNQKITLVVIRILAWLAFLVAAALFAFSWTASLLFLTAVCTHLIAVEAPEVEPKRKAFLLGILRNYIVPGISMDELESKRNKILSSSSSDYDKETKLMEVIEKALVPQEGSELTFSLNIKEAYVLLNTESFESNLLNYFSRIKG